jgi:hypothetical protein
MTLQIWLPKIPLFSPAPIPFLFISGDVQQKRCTLIREAFGVPPQTPFFKKLTFGDILPSHGLLLNAEVGQHFKLKDQIYNIL